MIYISCLCINARAGQRYRRLDGYALDGKVATEFAADSGFTADEQLRIMATQYMLYDREAEADPTVAPRSATVDTEKPFGQARQMLFRDSLPGVGDDQIPRPRPGVSVTVTAG